MRKILTFAVLALCLAACQKEASGGKNPFSTVQAYAGGVFSAEMETNPSTGYSWQITNAQDLKYVKLTSSDVMTKKTDPELAGAPALQRFEFAVNPGTAGKTETVRFAYFRSWETGVAPAEQKIYTIEIK